jgi:hypothetical protein
LQLLLDWDAGRVTLSRDELYPPVDWQFLSHPGHSRAFFYPPDWTAFRLWASGLTASGAVDWQLSWSPSSTMAASRIVSPEGNALYEAVIGLVSGVTLDLQQAQLAAEQGALGDGQVTDPICHYENTVRTDATWTHAGWYGDLAVTTAGNVFTDVVTIGNQTYLDYQSFIGPKDQYTSLVRSVFIPILYQIRTSGSSRGEPTPTPGF